MSQAAWERLPVEMRMRPQWCIAAPDKSPYSYAHGRLYRASNVEPSQWLPFEEACRIAIMYGAGIGYILHEDDPFCCIDLDVVDAESQARKGKPVDPSLWTTKEDLDRFWKIVQAFQSYTERSTHGKGLHIWVRGNIGSGKKRNGVEVYSQERFMVCTGDAILWEPVREGGQNLEMLVAEIRREGEGERQAIELVEVEEKEPDSVIWQRAASASNSEKFIALCEGRWQELGYPSQSEADFALMSIFTFYSDSNEQCRRMFRQTALGQRKKAVKDNKYLNFTLQPLRARIAAERARDVKVTIDAEALLNQIRKPTTVAELVQAMQEIAAPTVDVNAPQPAPAPVALATMAPAPVALEQPAGGIPWPPGLIGAIAGFIYKSSPRPVKEVAIVAALGLVAGICGRAYAIPQSGLNLYIILVARSAVGKEAMHSGISLIMKKLMDMGMKQIQTFVNFTDYASGPALMKECAVNNSFVNIAGEWGRKLKRLSNDSGDGPMQSLRTVMTNLYQKSGPSAIVGGISYSKADQNIASIAGVAYSMIGETTPGTLYESLTESMMEDGFLSRFLIVEYLGVRPAHNYDPQMEPDRPLIEAIAQLCQHSLDLNNRLERQEVGRDQESADLLYQFDKECDANINGTNDESRRQMWNRAALKCMRISALLAAADNCLHPVIQRHHVEWALDVVRRDIQVMSKKLDDGDVGVTDDSRERKILAVAREYITYGAAKGYKIPEKMMVDGILPRSYIVQKVGRVSSFVNHKLGSTAAMDLTIKSLIDSGFFIECARDKVIDAYGYHGKCYRVLNLDKVKS